MTNTRKAIKFENLVQVYRRDVDDLPISATFRYKDPESPAQRGNVNRNNAFLEVKIEPIVEGTSSHGWRNETKLVTVDGATFGKLAKVAAGIAETVAMKLERDGIAIEYREGKRVGLYAGNLTNRAARQDAGCFTMGIDCTTTNLSGQELLKKVNAAYEETLREMNSQLGIAKNAVTSFKRSGLTF